MGALPIKNASVVQTLAILFVASARNQLDCGISPLARRLLMSAITSGKSVMVSIM
jgi:hypothetical protein